MDVSQPNTAPTRADVVLAVGCALATAAPWTRAEQYSYFGWQQPLWPAILLAAVVGLAAWQRRRRPILFALCALLAWVAVAAFIPVLVAQYTVAERTRSWPITVAITVPTVVLVGFSFWWATGPGVILPLSAGICAVPALLGLYVGGRRDLLVKIQERAERLARERELQVMHARSEERAQIARDMHDVVTHRVSLMVLHATALEAASGRDAVALAQQIGSIGRGALEELRALVGVLRNDDAAPLAPQPGLADLADLVAQSRRLGVPVTLDMPDTPDVRPPALVQHAVYRVVQEALTNVRKHAGAAPTVVRIRQSPTELHLSVINGVGGDTGDHQLPNGGHGLLGIGERVRLVGGELSAQSTVDGGFEVVALIPLAVEPAR